jgi:hypothetical protein
MSTSDPTAIVPTPPAPSPQPTPSEGAGDGGASGTVVDQTTPAAAAQPPAPVAPDPFPRVLISGRLVAGGGARLTLLVVLAPPGWHVAVDCRGRGCPARARNATTTGSATRLRAYERAYRPGTWLVIRITRDGTMGKYSSFHIRARRAPTRTDLCLAPGSTKATTCPT